MQTIIFSDVLYPGYGKNAGAYRIATELRNAGYSCQVVDFFCHYTPEEIEKIINKFVTSETLWVGFSTTFMLPVAMEEADSEGQYFDKMGGAKITDINSAYPFSSDTMRDIFNSIRSRNPRTKIVVGGARSSAAQSYDGMLRRVKADYYVHGYADVSIVALTKWIEDPANTEPSFSNSRRSAIDSTRDYDFEHYNTSGIRYLQSDIITADEYLPIEIARGCIFKCKFCNFALLGKKRGDYTRTKEVLVNEFIYNYETFGTTNYMFMDETTNDSMEKAEFLLEVTNSLPFKIRWGGYARLELYANNPEMAAVMQATGAVHNFFGIETFNKRSGEVIGKGMHPDKVKSVLANLKQIWHNNVSITAGIIVGLPYETRATLAELEQYLLSDSCAIDAWVIHPLILVDGMASMFGQDPGKYGYHFNRSESRMQWHNSEMNFADAVEIATHIRNVTMSKARINSWSHMRLQNLGYSQAEVDSMTVQDYFDRMDAIQHKKLSRKDLYLESLLKL
jgi:hypothetical protein